MNKITYYLIKSVTTLIVSIIICSNAIGASAIMPNEVSFNIRKDSIIKILAIGNSFSEDATEHYLYGLAKAGGYRVIIGNLYIGGAPLDLHWKNASGDLPAYTYRKINTNGEKETLAKTSISKALADEHWDFISLQQASPKSGLLETYIEPLPLLMSYVRKHSSNPNAKYIFHQTWAYAQDSNHKGFASYGNNQLTMYKAIAETSKKVKAMGSFDLLIPAGTAIQNARNSFIGDRLCRDGYHLDLNIGRYIASCTWYEAIFKRSVIGNPYQPPKSTDREVRTGQEAAHKAIEKPYMVSKMK